MNAHSYSGDVINPSNKKAEPDSHTALTSEAFERQEHYILSETEYFKTPTTPSMNEDDYQASINYEEDYSLPHHISETSHKSCPVATNQQHPDQHTETSQIKTDPMTLLAQTLQNQ